MDQAQSHFFAPRRTLNCNGRILRLDQPVVMGVINVNADSFYAPSRFNFGFSIARRAKQIVAQGGGIIDIGACSTRPGAAPITEREELRALDRALAAVRGKLPAAILSVDTFRATVARRMVREYGANMINDVSAGAMDPDMLPTVAQLGVPYVAGHMQGTPQDMQINPTYDDVVREVLTFFAQRVSVLRRMGIIDVVIDPGFGFGKTLEHNFTLLNHLNAFGLLELPIMVGVSRKSMVYKALGTTPEGSLNGTTALNTMALLRGASILRVHDVAPAVEVVQLVQRATASLSSIAFAKV